MLPATSRDRSIARMPLERPFGIGREGFEDPVHGMPSLYGGAGPANSWSASGERDQRRRHGAAQQGLARRPLAAVVELFEELHLAAGEERHRQPVAIEQAGARGPGRARAPA